MTYRLYMTLLSHAVVMLCFFAPPAHAGAWLQPEGAGQLITTMSSYHATKFYDINGTRAAQDPFSKIELNPYIEYGLTQALTVGANVLMNSNSASTNPFGGREDYYGLQGELFARTALWEKEGSILSLQPLVKLPVYYADKGFYQTQYTRADVELALLAGTHFSAMGFTHFLDGSAAYRVRSGAPGNQAKFNLTLGTQVNDEWTILTQAFSTWAVSPPALPSLTQRTEDDYDAIKLQLSAVYALTNTLSVQAGGFINTHPRNTGAGSGVLAALWWNF